MKELVSIAMATYNGAKYLEEQLDSIYAQTYKNIEVVVTDDFSNDNTLEILQKYAYKYGLKYFVNETNIGVTKNFEKAISLCTGEYIALADQDDIWLPEKLELLLEKIGDASLIYSNAAIINEKSELQDKTAEKIYPLFGLDSKTFDLYNYITLTSIVLGCTSLFKRELLETLLPIYETSRNHDWWLQVCAHNHNGIKYISDTLIYYRHHDSNYSRGHGYSFLKSMTSYFSPPIKSMRKKRIMEQLKIVNKQLEDNKYKTDNEKQMLLDIGIYCNSLLQTTIHVKAFFLSIKYYKYMFFNKKTTLNLLNLFSRLVS